MDKKCVNCRFSYCGELNMPMTAAHRYETDTFKFIETEDDLTAIPIYDLTCENEANWLPSRGELLIYYDDTCKHFEPREVKLIES